jgi:hypothetical protein
MSGSAAPQTNTIDAMFVQLAGGVTSDGHSITLQKLGPATLFFADRPERVVGHVSSAKFVSQWGEGENSFAEDPPNAVISFIESGDTIPEEVTLVLRNPQLSGDSLTYAVDVLEGSLPSRAGPCSLFIDPIGRPLSPVSVAGVRRRERRRGW